MSGDWRETGRPCPPESLTFRGEPNGFQLYDMSVVDALDGYLQTLRAYARAQDLPADATTAEFGPGQFEVNLLHRADALAAADDCLYLKRIAEQAARRHGLKSTCMAKPYSEHAGSGLHVHASIIDGQGRNILDAKGGEPKMLKSAIAGLLDSMRAAQLIFAPFANSYRRFQAGLVCACRSDLGKRPSRHGDPHPRQGWAGRTHRAPRRRRRRQSLSAAGSDPRRHAHRSRRRPRPR